MRKCLRCGTEMKAFLRNQGIEVAGIFSCFGYNTFGPFKLIGGRNKGHPNEDDLRNYKEYIKELIHNGH